MSNTLFPIVFFQSLPTSLEAQGELLRGMAFSAVFREAPSAARILETYQGVQDDRRTVAPEQLSALLEELLTHRMPTPDLHSPLDLRLPPIFRPPLRITTTSAAAKIVPNRERGTAALLDMIDQEIARVRKRFEKTGENFDGEERSFIESALDEFAGSAEFWRRESHRVSGFHGTDRARYLEDMAIGERILIDRIQRISALVYAEPQAVEKSGGFHLKTRPQPPDYRAEGFVLALVNHDVGFGSLLALRPHQIGTLHLFKGLFRKVLEMMKTKDVLPEELLRGTVVMPQGGGKTRTMVACFAAIIELGGFDAARGDRFFVFDHTDQIHGQNLGVMELLSDYFRKKFGRDLRVSEYKAEHKDLSGDIVIVSIPSVNNVPRRARFEAELVTILGPNGRVVATAIDEVHHLDLSAGRSRETWRELVSVVRRASPNMVRIGFTATPTPTERPFIRIKDIDLMRAGVTPRTYLAKVEGVDLQKLKVSRETRDFVTQELTSALLEHPDRNKRIFEALEERGLRKKEASPGGAPGLEPTLFFGTDLRHARMMADAYAAYFGQNGDGLKNRKVRMVGGQQGRMTAASLDEALQSYREGRTDAVIAMVSGRTPEKVRQKVLEAAARGEVEAVFSVDLWYEGADLYMFSHIVGSRPTFSRYKKGQERGRANRRGPDDVSPEGVLRNDKPKILFDVVDRYRAFDRSLIFYGDVMGVLGYAPLPAGRLFDAMSGQVVNAVDREGKDVPRTPLNPVYGPVKRPAKPAVREVRELDWEPLARKLQDILEKRYRGDVEGMAEDLGIAGEEIESFLEGCGWEQAHWFLRRLATLLYQERDVFVDLYHEARGVGDAQVSPADQALLRKALAVYEEWEGSVPDQGVAFEGNLGMGPTQVLATPYALGQLSRGTISDQNWKVLWQGITLYFGWKSRDASFPDARRDEARKRFESHMEYFFRRQSWKTDLATAGGRLLYEARKALALKRAGDFSLRHHLEGVARGHSGRDQFSLHDWVRGEPVRYSNGYTPKGHYDQVKSLMAGLGVDASVADLKIQEAVFEERGWEERGWPAEVRDGSDGMQVLLWEVRRDLARNSGGRLLIDHGIPNVPRQPDSAALTTWLRTGDVAFGQRLTRKEFFHQISSLLLFFGRTRDAAARLIERGVFSAEGWPGKAGTAREALLLAAQKLVAVHFGGRLPIDHGIAGVKDQQSDRAPITLWLRGEKIAYSRKLPPHLFYNQVRSLLVGLGMAVEEANRLIQKAVFEERGWEDHPETAKDRMLLESRRAVAVDFGGVIPAAHGLVGVSQQHAEAPLSRWIREGQIAFGRGLKRDEFFRQVRALLTGLGAKR